MLLVFLRGQGWGGYQLLLGHGDKKLKAGFLKATLSRLFSTASSLVGYAAPESLGQQGSPRAGFPAYTWGAICTLSCVVKGSTYSMGLKHKFWRHSQATCSPLAL